MPDRSVERLGALALERMLDIILERFRLVEQFQIGGALFFKRGILDGIQACALDLLWREIAAVLNRDGLLLSGRTVLCRYLNDAVDVDIKRDLDLRTSAHALDAGQAERAEQLVVA